MALCFSATQATKRPILKPMLVRRCLQKWRQSHMLLAKILRSQRRPRVVQDLSYLGKLLDPSTACRLCLEEKIQKLLVASRGEEAGCTLQWMLLFSRNEFPNISMLWRPSLSFECFKRGPWCHCHCPLIWNIHPLDSQGQAANWDPDPNAAAGRLPAQCLENGIPPLDY